MSVSFLLLASVLILRTQDGAMKTVCLLALLFWYARSAYAERPRGRSVSAPVRALSQQVFQARQRDSGAPLFHVHELCFLGPTEIHALLVEPRELVHDQADRT